MGIGRRPDLALALARRGVDVRAVDVHPPADLGLALPDELRVRVADVTALDVQNLDEFYRVEAVYSRHCPPELHRPVRDLARAVDAPFLFTTLGHDEPIVPVSRERVGDQVLYVADEDVPGPA